jgi:hypothetical protein
MNESTVTQVQKLTQPALDFKPLFYILDKCENRVLVAKKQDSYEVKGMYVRFDKVKKEWEIWPASFNGQLPWEFPDRFIITKDEQEAWLFAEIMSITKPLPGDVCLAKYPRSEDFPKY